MNKTDLRKKFKLLRASLSVSDIEDLSIAIANNLLKTPVWKGTYYHLFLSIAEKREIDTSYILSILQGKDKEIVVSKTHIEDNSLTHYLLTENTRLVKSKWGIPEPVDGIEVPLEKLDVVFVPLLAFDKNGQRIGYGKGFYDTFLSKCRPDVIKIGLSFFEAEPDIDNIYETDVPLDYCITPTTIYTFTK
ncbi:5-formyltetrahydrofolate cyclo-ligase [Neptunitalea chrysea]|uniref:5-formyltetrahydrofolate cyclo-ligase n=1 Tax=Neptunitalea chrysea TaxID=1647581 RepID=A0A9W6B8T5_9FLAO|nr:5-formyltetrahydrofolate cyclo-ligase [Neptunitalea chrysea]GLB53940.1 5-formyltetrahydrofolate cyclo-ligase [Neptunitalea chrysea]